MCYHFLGGLVVIDSKNSGFWFLALAQILVSLNIVTSKFLISVIPVLILLEIRFLIAFAALLGLHFQSNDKKQSISNYLGKLHQRDWFYMIIQALTAGVLFNCFMITGLKYTDANMAGIINSALPALVAFVTAIVFKETLSRDKITCILLATLGLVLISFTKFYQSNASHSLRGDMIILISLIPETTYYVLCRVYSNRLPLFLSSSLVNAINAICLFPALWFIDWQPSSISLYQWFLISLLGLTSGLFYVFWFKGSLKSNSSMTALSISIMPLSTIVLSWLALGEKISNIELLGMSLVLLSILFSGANQKLLTEMN